jgi:DNA-binding transcriptional ArsR family regulator
MDNELDLLLGTAIDSLVKLDILLLFHARPGSVSRPEEVARQVGHPETEVSQTLDQLSEAGLVERFVLGSGRHAVYGPSDEDRVRGIIAAIKERYDRDPSTRAGLVRDILRVPSEEPRPIDTS